MNPKPIADFEYFIGKVCSIHTRGINWKLDDRQTVDYYVGIVELINECGICLSNVINGSKTFIFTPSVVAIAEETVLDRNNPESEKVLREYEEKKRRVYPEFSPAKPQTAKERPLQTVDGNPFVDIESITRFARAAKEKSGLPS